MNNLVKTFNTKFNYVLRLILQGFKTKSIVCASLGISTMTFLFVIYIKRRDKSLILNYQSCGYLSLIKQNINNYETLVNNSRNKSITQFGSRKNVFNLYVKKFYSVPNGITNFGNNCYINVLLQCLASNPDFIVYIKSFIQSDLVDKLSKKDIQIITELEETLEKINSETSVISPNSLINKINNKFSFEHEQQDSYELYHRLLELFEGSDTLHSVSNTSTNPFLIHLDTHLKCESCNNLISKSEEALDISVTPDYTKFTINTLIDSFFKPTKISDYTCSKCTVKNINTQCETKMKNFSRDNLMRKKYETLSEYIKEIARGNLTDDLETIVNKIVFFCEERGCSEILNNLKLNAIKTNLTKISEIDVHPKILTVHIQKVFFEEEMITTNKLKIVFPEILVLKGKNGLLIKYELTSFIEHFGSHNFGHYIAYRKFYDKWVYINDSTVKIVPKSRAFEVSDPYILLYRLIDN